MLEEDTMQIEKVILRIIEMPLKRPFTTHLATVKSRESIIVEVIDREGHSGYGEVVAFSSPWYTEETVQTAYHMLRDFLIPIIFKNDIQHPEIVESLFAPIKGNPMAKAGLETAIWDLYAKKCNKSIADVIGGVRKKVAAGAVVAAKNISAAIDQIEKFQDLGYQRIKLKIHPGFDFTYIKEIRNQFPHVPLMADANSGYSLEQIPALQALDSFNLMMIEQPFATDDLLEHAMLQKQIQTPVCLDESITSLHDAESAIQMGSCQVMNIKIGRVGGLQTAIRIHNLCIANDVKLWCGGMIEFGISKAFNLALASLPGFTLPGDLPASDNYWEEDIIEPQIEVKNGYIDVPAQPGIGFSINWKRLNDVTIHKDIFKREK